MADQEQGRPNPITKAAESSNLPRQARARIGATTDPMPEGKELDAAPELHFKVEPASHDKERTEPKSAAELGLSQHMLEVSKAHPPGEEGKHHMNPAQAGMDWMGASTSSNKKMDSHHRGNDFQATDRGHSKHLDSVYRSQ